MRHAVLVDTGPLVGILHRDDQAHARCVEAFRAMSSRLLTVWPVLTEAMHLLAFSPRAQDGLWEMVVRQALELASLTAVDVPRLRELMGLYSDLPMDLADAALVRVAERERISTVFTLDQDFRVYAPRHVAAFELVP